MQQRPSTVAIWWHAFRFHFVPPSFLPAILGGVIAWATTRIFHPGYFIATVVGVTINHIALNMTDDYYDYQHAVDQMNNRERNPYSGGSGTLTNGLIKPRQMFWAFMIGYLITIIIGLYLTVMRGWIVFAFGIFGIWCAYFYTAPPIRYGYHGLGELSQLVNFSFTIGMGSFFVQCQCFSWEPFGAILPLGFMMFSMITINEIPDEQNDRQSGKRNLVVIFGKQKAVWLYGISMLIAYLIIVYLPLQGLTSYWIYLSLITFPWFIKAFLILYRNLGEPLEMSPANLLTIRIHNFTGILLIVAYMLQGIQKNHDTQHIWPPLVMLILLYFPVALPIFFNRKLGLS